jgi:transcriptional regulator with XRE-family HTH domain
VLADVPSVKGTTSVTVGENIRMRRLSLGLSERELGYRVGADGQYIRRWEGGKVTPNIHNLRALARELNVSMDALLDGAPDTNDTGAAA